MKEQALALVSGTADPSSRLNMLREYLQALLLRIMHQQEAFSAVAFVGGTVLRFLENLPRFSEDLDFSLLSAELYRPEAWLAKIERELELAGFDCTVSWNSERPVHGAWVHIDGLLQEAGLAVHPNQKLSVKLEFDTKPPQGAEVRRSVVNRHFIVGLVHYDLESLMATKIHALIARPYPKGRDWFDLLWYRSRRPAVEPRLDLLQNALEQTSGVATAEASAWRRLLLDRIEEIDFSELRRDIVPFLERPSDRDLLTVENIKAVLS